MNTELEYERTGSLVECEIACLWCWFENEQGDFSIAYFDDEDGHLEPNDVIASVPAASVAKQLVRQHNVAALAMLEGVTPEVQGKFEANA